HEDALETQTIGDDVRGDLSAFVAGDLPSLVAEAATRRRELRVLEHTALSFREQAAAATSGFFPRLDAIGEITVADPNTRIFPARDTFDTTWSVGLVLSWSPNDALAAAPSRSGALAKERQTIEQRRALADQLRTEVSDAWHAHAEALATLDAARRG